MNSTTPSSARSCGTMSDLTFARALSIVLLITQILSLLYISQLEGRILGLEAEQAACEADVEIAGAGCQLLLHADSLQEEGP